jgi:hypothetical protein
LGKIKKKNITFETPDGGEVKYLITFWFDQERCGHAANPLTS